MSNDELYNETEHLNFDALRDKTMEWQTISRGNAERISDNWRDHNGKAFCDFVVQDYCNAFSQIGGCCTEAGSLESVLKERQSRFEEYKKERRREAAIIEGQLYAIRQALPGIRNVNDRLLVAIVHHNQEESATREETNVFFEKAKNVSKEDERLSARANQLLNC